MTKMELIETLMAREEAMSGLTLNDRIAAAINELERDEALHMANLMIEVASMYSEGDITRAMKFVLMGGLELGRELERRV